jgi:hypothetical protein
MSPNYRASSLFICRLVIHMYVSRRRYTPRDRVVSRTDGTMDWAGIALTVLVPLLPGVYLRMASERAEPATAAVLEPRGTHKSRTRVSGAYFSAAPLATHVVGGVT